MPKVVISQHSYPHDAGHSEVPTHIKHYRRDIEYPPLMLKGHYQLSCLKSMVEGVAIRQSDSRETPSECTA